MKFTVYQVSEAAPARFLFADLPEAVQAGGVLRSHYDEVCVGYYDEDDGEKDGEILEELFMQFNGPRKPEGYAGRSMSVSDVVILEDAEEPRMWYCGRVGWHALDGWDD